MAIPEFKVDMDIISKLGEYPGADDGLTPDGFKKKFDLAGKYIQEYINTILLPNLNQIVDVESLLNGILDPTLTQPDKAARAKEVGEKLQQVRTETDINQALFFDHLISGGDHVLGTDQQFRAEMLDTNTVRVFGGEAVIQGHIFSLNIGSYVSVEVDPGVYGTYRNDLICARYERDEYGTNRNRIVLIKGTDNQTAGIDPVYMKDNINAEGAATADIPLYRIKVVGVDVYLEKMFEVTGTVTDLVAEAVISKLSKWEGGSY